MGFKAIFPSSLLLLQVFGNIAAASSTAVKFNEPHADGALDDQSSPAAARSTWWFAGMDRRGAVPFASNASDYKIVRDVRDYGAKGNGIADDTEAINLAITAGGTRCGLGCDSSTTTPAIIYFPPGTYVVSKPLVSYYYTQLIGDALDLPTLKASPNFAGIAVIDANPKTGENNWFTNQNNFFRQVRNFKIDLTDVRGGATGIHWQVAQATSLQNIEFNMSETPTSTQQGIFMENGSGGFMADLTFNGGTYGIVVGSQQFTVRNFKFNKCQTAIKQLWGWIWTYHNLKIDGCQVGVDMSTEGSVQTVGALLVADSAITNTPIGIKTNYNVNQLGTNGSLIIDNVDFSGSAIAISRVTDNTTILAGNSKVVAWAQGRQYIGANGEPLQATFDALKKPAALLDQSGKVLARSKDQYVNVDLSKFISVKSKGARGDGVTDDTMALQAIFNQYVDGQVIYFDHGAYLITDTVHIPANVRIVGEIWPMILAGGNKSFLDINNPKPALVVGKAGDSGDAQISDLIIGTAGAQPGAILMQWNAASASKGGAGLWDVHFRVGGYAGSALQSDKCSKTPDVTTSPKVECYGAWMLLHVTSSATIYMENNWLWVSDHELDRDDHNQINIYNGRGLLVESTKGAWLWGTASEHNVMYNYQLSRAANVFMGAIQTETAYMQGNPDARIPFQPVDGWNDPDFGSCVERNCARTWGLRILESRDVLFYGGGMYSFFDNYTQQCLDTEDCQLNMVDIQGTSLTMYGMSTKATLNMISVNGKAQMQSLPDNKGTFCSTLSLFRSS